MLATARLPSSERSSWPGGRPPVQEQVGACQSDGGTCQYHLVWLPGCTQPHLLTTATQQASTVSHGPIYDPEGEKKSIN